MADDKSMTSTRLSVLSAVRVVMIGDGDGMLMRVLDWN